MDGIAHSLECLRNDLPPSGFSIAWAFAKRCCSIDLIRNTFVAGPGGSIKLFFSNKGKGRRNGRSLRYGNRPVDWDRLKRSASEERMEQVREFDRE